MLNYPPTLPGEHDCQKQVDIQDYRIADPMMSPGDAMLQCNHIQTSTAELSLSPFKNGLTLIQVENNVTSLWAMAPFVVYQEFIMSCWYIDNARGKEILTLKCHVFNTSYWHYNEFNT